MPERFNTDYYSFNRQDSDRPALRFYARLARKHCPPGRLLDFGCGTGYLLKRLREFTQIDGFDISEYARQATAERVPGAVIHAELDAIPQESFSGIIALHVLEHVDDAGLARILYQWNRVLMPGGRVICVVPDPNGKGFSLKRENWFAFRDPSHINLKSRGEWRSLFTSAGFSVLKVGTDGLWDFPYSSWAPRWLDAALHSIGTVVQFLAGDLLLAEGKGESVILILEKPVEPSSPCAR